jgi:signal transduction histidine kinase
LPRAPASAIRQGKHRAWIDRNTILLDESPRFEASRKAHSGMLRHRPRDGIEVYDVFTHSDTTGWTIAIGVPVAEIEAAARAAQAEAQRKAKDDFVAMQDHELCDPLTAIAVRGWPRDGMAVIGVANTGIGIGIAPVCAPDTNPDAAARAA